MLLPVTSPQVDCPNFIRVLQPMNSTHLYACGSYAYNPHDALLVGERGQQGSVSLAQRWRLLLLLKLQFSHSADALPLRPLAGVVSLHWSVVLIWLCFLPVLPVLPVLRQPLSPPQDIQTLTLTSVSAGAKGRCPFNPFERNTAITLGTPQDPPPHALPLSSL